MSSQSTTTGPNKAGIIVWSLFVVVLVVVFGLLARFILTQPDPSLDPDALAPELYESEMLRVGEHSVTVGRADAPIQVRVFEDIQCPHCKSLEETIAPQLDEWIDQGKVAVEYVTVNYLGVRSQHDFSTRSANLLAFVAARNPEAYVDVKMDLFAVQPDPRMESGPTDADLIEIARNNGVEVSADDERLITEQGFRTWVESATEYAVSENVGGIPTVFINGALVAEASDPEIFLGIVGEMVSATE